MIYHAIRDLLDESINNSSVYKIGNILQTLD